MNTKIYVKIITQKHPEGRLYMSLGCNNILEAIKNAGLEYFSTPDGAAYAVAHGMRLNIDDAWDVLPYSICVKHGFLRADANITIHARTDKPICHLFDAEPCYDLVYAAAEHMHAQLDKDALIGILDRFNITSGAAEDPDRTAKALAESVSAKNPRHRTNREMLWRIIPAALKAFIS